MNECCHYNHCSHHHHIVSNTLTVEEGLLFSRQEQRLVLKECLDSYFNLIDQIKRKKIKFRFTVELLCYFQISLLWDHSGWHLRLSQLQQKALFPVEGAFPLDMAVRNLLRYSVSTFMSLMLLSLLLLDERQPQPYVHSLPNLAAHIKKCLYGGGGDSIIRVLQQMWTVTWVFAYSLCPYELV